MERPVTETVKRRRRWLWGIVAVVALLIGGRIAWRFRPLNATEQKLVGSWVQASDPVAPTFTFRPDRTFVWSQTNGFEMGSGVWSCSSSAIEIEFDSDAGLSPSRIFQRVSRRIFGANRRTLRLDEPGSAVIGRDAYSRIAVPLSHGGETGPSGPPAS